MKRKPSKMQPTGTRERREEKDEGETGKGGPTKPRRASAANAGTPRPTVKAGRGATEGRSQKSRKADTEPRSRQKGKPESEEGAKPPKDGKLGGREDQKEERERGGELRDEWAPKTLLYG